MAKPVVQIPVDETFISKLTKAQKELKMSSKAECGRTLLEYVLDNDISELKSRMDRSRLEKQRQEVEATLQELSERKQKLDKQLEKLEPSNA